MAAPSGPVTKERLKRYRRLKEEIERQGERLARMESAIESPPKVLDGTPHSSFAADRLAIAVARKIALEDAMLASLKEEAAEVAEIERAIQLLTDPQEREMLRLRYIDGYEWADICGQLNCSWTQTHRVHSRALQSILIKTS